MRCKYIIYPETTARLDSSRINQRIQEAVDNYDITFLSCLGKSEVAELAREMKDAGIFTHLQEDTRKEFMKKMNNLFKAPEKHSWRTERFNGTEATEEVELEDVVGLVGWWSSQVLEPKEVFDYEKFGFKNITDFTGSVAALINQTLNRGGREGYKWEFRTPEGRVLANEITGDSNCDLRIYRTDITPYRTFDPLGNEVSFRPEMEADRFGVSPHHSVEDNLLAAVIKWIDQTGIKSKSLENKARDTLEWVKSLGQGGGTCTEHFFGAPDELRTNLSYAAGFPLPKLNPNDESEQSCPNELVASPDYFYGVYIGPNNELAFAIEDRERKPSTKKNIVLRFTPEEADHLIKGLLYQSAAGLGRTSAAQLIAVLEYRFSREYESEVKKFNQFRNP